MLFSCFFLITMSIISWISSKVILTPFKTSVPYFLIHNYYDNAFYIGSLLNCSNFLLEDCPIRTFGLDCSTICHCASGTGCHPVDGACATGVGCERGWKGPTCSIDGEYIGFLERVYISLSNY